MISLKSKKKNFVGDARSDWKPVKWKNIWVAEKDRSRLKALFNNVFTFKNLSCMAIHAISVFDKV